mgnify:FL=1
MTGEVVGGGTGTVSDGAAVYADPSTVLVADRAGDTRAFAWLSGLLLVTLVVLPGLYVSALRRRGPAGARS